MYYNENIQKWIEKTNPSLLFLQSNKKQSGIKKREINICQGTEALVIDGVCDFFYQDFLDNNGIILFIEDDGVNIAVAHILSVSTRPVAAA